MDLKEIQDLIRFVSKSGVTEVELERDGFKIVIKAEKPTTEYHAVMQQPMMMQQAPAPMAAAPVADSGVGIKSPMIGTFYRSGGPDKDAFVKVGDRVEKGQVVCIIEAMKLFNEIESEVSGTITKVMVENASPVEYDQPLFLVDPS